MYLKSLTLRGFKTFADKTTIEFGASGGIIAIVGPNGCGKSNILDSIRWALGEQSLKEIRSSSLEDIIFAGTSARKPLSLGEVTLTVDNSDKFLPIEYSEIAIKRRIFRSGESEFFINKDSVRLKDIRDLFMDTGLGRGSYSIINQGQVDAILSSKPEERRAPFEEAAQISKYRFRKEAAGRKLIATEQNLLRINDIRGELSSRLGVLEEQAAKAKEYKEIRAKLKELEIGLCRKQLQGLNERKASLSDRIEKIRVELEQASGEFGRIEEDRIKIREELHKKEADIEAAIGGIEEKIRTGEAAKRGLEIEEVRERNLMEQLGSNEREIEEMRPRLLEYTNKFSEKQKNLAASRGELRAKEAELNELKNTYSALQEESARIEREIESKKSAVFDAESRLTSLRNRLIELGGSSRFAKEEISRDSKAVSKLEKELSEIKQELESANGRAKEQEAALSKFETGLDEASRRRKDLEQKLSESEALLSARREELSQKSSKLSFLKGMLEEHQGFFEGVREAVKSSKKHPAKFKIIGVVADLIKVEEKYELAIEAALSSNLQLIITKSDAHAKEMIDHLRSENLGKASFLPLNLLKKTEELSADKFASAKGFVEIARNLVSCDNEGRGAIDYLLGRTLVFDNLDNAIKFFKEGRLSSGEKAVTLSGELLTSAGIISGGSPSKKTAVRLGRERELISLSEEADELQTGISSVTEEISKLKSDVKESERQIDEISIEKNHALLSLGKANHERDSLTEAFKSTKDELELVSEGLSARNSEIEDIGRAVEATSKDIESCERGKTGLETELKDLISKSGTSSSSREEHSHKLTELRIEASRLSRDFAATEEEAAILKENIDRIEGMLKVKQELDLPQKISASKEEIARLSERVPQLEAERVELEQTLKEKREERARLTSSIEGFENKIRDAEGRERALREKLSKEEVSGAKTDAEMEMLSSTVTGEYGIAIDDILNSVFEVPNQAKGREEAGALKGSLKALGDVNLLAIEEFEKSRDRLAFIESQFTDLSQARENLKALMDELDKAARESFLETIRVVSENFSEIFSDLFEGGEAKIMLIESDDVLDAGIEIVARPYGKKWLSLELLSGGEKALTAIAILFALLKTHPSPFCFLDEVDAALDDANVIRFGKMLLNFAKETQIMVITHNKRTMSAADILYGVTMEEPGISKIVSMKLAEVS